MSNCPNCGTPIISWKCEYCETVFDGPKLKNDLLVQTAAIRQRRKDIEERLKDVFDTSTEEQKTVVYALIGINLD